MALQSWIKDCLKMYKFIEETMKTGELNWLQGEKGLAKIKIQRGIFQSDALSPLLLVIAMMPLSQILRKCTDEYELQKSLEKYQPPNLHGRHQTVCKN